MMFHHQRLSVSVLSFLSSLQQVYGHPQEKAFERRDQVAQCSASLVALKASAFCSSFISLSDVVQTQIFSSIDQETVTVCKSKV
jgi:hypothetical protein